MPVGDERDNTDRKIKQNSPNQTNKKTEKNICRG